MPEELKDLGPPLKEIERLKNELAMKQLQLNRLLNITQAINNNAKEAELFEMFTSFVGFEMQVSKFSLFIEAKDGSGMQCVAHSGLSKKVLANDVKEEDLKKYAGIQQTLQNNPHPYFSQFEFAVPVKHKDRHIAYAFVSGINQDLAKLQLITAVINVLAVAIENKRLFKSQLNQKRLEEEINLASAMQRTLVPEVLPSRTNYEFAQVYKPHLGEVGGDFYDCIEKGNKVVFCVADISGKGLAAALLMANALAILRSSAGNFDSLVEFVRDFNRSVYRITQGDKYLTMFYAEWEPDSRMLRFVNAGHVYPMLFREGEITELVSGSTVLGSFEDLPFIKMAEVHIPGDAILFAYTDGLTDVMNESGEMFNEDRLKAFVQKIGNLGLSAEAFNEALMTEINDFKGEDMPYTDDLTILTCKIQAAIN